MDCRHHQRRGHAADTGTLTLSSASDKDLRTTLENKGTIVDSAGNTRFYNGILQNDATGIYDFQNAAQIDMANDGGTNAFSNSGTLEHSTGAGAAVFDGSVPFNNAASGKITLGASVGSVLLAGGGTDLGGTFTVGTSSILDLTDGSNPTFTGTYTGSGGGFVQLNSGTITIGSGGATFNFPQSLFQWNGGYISGSPTLTNASGAFINLDTSTTKSLRAPLENKGTIIDNAGNTDFYYATLQNDAGAVYDFENAAAVHMANDGGTNAFNNSGTVKADGAGTVNFDGSVPFNNAAGGKITLGASAGTVSLAGGGTDLGGTFTVGSGSVLDLTGGSNPTFTGTYTGSGAGFVQMNTGTITIGSGGATFNFPQSLFQWNGGYISGSPTLTNASGAFINLDTSTTKSLRAPLENKGTIIDNAGNTDFYYATLQNDAGAVYDFENAAAVHMANDGGTNAFNNSGTVKADGAGTVNFDGSVPFNNAAGGKITLGASAGTVSLAGGGTDLGGTFTVGSGSVLDLTGGSNPTFTGTYTGSGAGFVQMNTGTLTIGSGGATFNFPQNFFQWNGGFISGGPTLTNASGAFINLDGTNDKDLRTTLDNKGTIIDNAGNTRFYYGVLDNDAGATYDFQNAAEVDMANDGGTNAFNNSGTLEHSTGAGTVVFESGDPFNNAAAGKITLAANVGGISLGGGGTDAGGTFTVGANSVLDLTDGSAPTLTGTYTGSGAGTVLMATGSLDVDTAGATFNFPAGLFRWEGGTIAAAASNSNVLLNTGFITLSTSTDKLLRYNLTLENQGTITDNQGNLRFYYGTVQNDSGGVFSFTNDTAQGEVDLTNDGGNNAFNNLAGGTVIKSTGASNVVIDSGVPYSGAGTTQASAAILEIDGTTLPQDSSGALTGGTWIANNATLSLPSEPTVSTIGSGAKVTLIGSAASFPLVAPVSTVNGTLGVLAGATFTTAGALANTGTISVGGKLTVSGDFMQNLGKSGAGSGLPGLHRTGRERRAAPGGHRKHDAGRQPAGRAHQRLRRHSQRQLHRCQLCQSDYRQLRVHVRRSAGVPRHDQSDEHRARCRNSAGHYLGVKPDHPGRTAREFHCHRQWLSALDLQRNRDTAERADVQCFHRRTERHARLGDGRSLQSHVWRIQWRDSAGESGICAHRGEGGDHHLSDQEHHRRHQIRTKRHLHGDNRCRRHGRIRTGRGRDLQGWHHAARNGHDQRRHCNFHHHRSGCRQPFGHRRVWR